MIRRHLHQKYNLLNVGTKPKMFRSSNHHDHPYRTADGKYNDPFNDDAGSQGTFFGRNVHPVYQKDKVQIQNYMHLITFFTHILSFLENKI